MLLVPRQIALWKSKSSSSLKFSHCVESESSLLCGHYKLTSVMKTWIEMSGNGIYIDYFMVGERVRFLFTSCEESQTNERVFERVSLRFFTTSE